MSKSVEGKDTKLHLLIPKSMRNYLGYCYFLFADGGALVDLFKGIKGFLLWKEQVVHVTLYENAPKTMGAVYVAR